MAGCTPPGGAEYSSWLAAFVDPQLCAQPGVVLAAFRSLDVNGDGKISEDRCMVMLIHAFSSMVCCDVCTSAHVAEVKTMMTSTSETHIDVDTARHRGPVDVLLACNLPNCQHLNIGGSANTVEVELSAALTPWNLGKDPKEAVRSGRGPRHFWRTFDPTFLKPYCIQRVHAFTVCWTLCKKGQTLFRSEPKGVHKSSSCLTRLGVGVDLLRPFPRVHGKAFSDHLPSVPLSLVEAAENRIQTCFGLRSQAFGANRLKVTQIATNSLRLVRD